MTKIIHTVQQDDFGVGCSPCFPDLGHRWSCWPMVANGAKCNIQVVRDPTIFVLERSRIQRSTAPKTDTRSPSCSLHAGAVAMNCLSVVTSTHSKNRNSDHPGIIPFRMEKSTKQFEKTIRNAASWNFVHLFSEILERSGTSRSSCTPAGLHPVHLEQALWAHHLFPVEQTAPVYCAERSQQDNLGRNKQRYWE